MNTGDTCNIEDETAVLKLFLRDPVTLIPEED